MITITIKKAAPKATEVISYSMPAFKQDGVLVYFAAFKSHYGFYPTAKPIEIFKKQCNGAGAMISFEVFGGEKEAFNVLNKLKLIKLAVSLGSNESLAQHPHSMTHADVPNDIKEQIGINKGLIRLSVGIENANDIIDDLKQALKDI